MTKKIKLILLLPAVLGVLVGVAYAYFTSTAQTADNTFKTGELTIDVTQNSMGGRIDPVIKNWFPGDTAQVTFEVKNTSPKAVNLAAYARGSWNNASLDDTMVKAIKVDYWKSGMTTDWTEIKSDPHGITGIVYYSPSGTNTDLYSVAPGETVWFRVTVKLDENADDAYENQTYTASVHVAATQVGGTFPAEF